MRTKTTRMLVLAAAAAFLLALGCSGEIGERCDTSGSTDECEGHAICTQEAGGATCRLICTDQSQCPPGHNCNGVSNSNIKSCQP